MSMELKLRLSERCGLPHTREQVGIKCCMSHWVVLIRHPPKAHDQRPSARHNAGASRLATVS